MSVYMAMLQPCWVIATVYKYTAISGRQYYHFKMSKAQHKFQHGVAIKYILWDIMVAYHDFSYYKEWPWLSSTVSGTDLEFIVNYI